MDAQNGDNPGPFTCRRSPVIPISVMPLREKEKVYPLIRAYCIHMQLIGMRKTYGMYAPVHKVWYTIPHRKMEACPRAGCD